MSYVTQVLFLESVLHVYGLRHRDLLDNIILRQVIHKSTNQMASLGMSTKQWIAIAVMRLLL